MKLLVRFIIIIVLMLFATSNYAQFSDPWGGSANGTANQDQLSPADGSGGTVTQPSFGTSSTPIINTTPDMTTFGAPPPPTGGGGGAPDATVPIDGGITLLLAAGIGKGIKSYRAKQKSK